MPITCPTCFAPATVKRNDWHLHNQRQRDCARREMVYGPVDEEDEGRCGEGGFSVIAANIRGADYAYPDDFNIEASDRTEEQADRIAALLGRVPRIPKKIRGTITIAPQIVLGRVPWSWRR